MKIDMNYNRFLCGALVILLDKTWLTGHVGETRVNDRFINSGCTLKINYGGLKFEVTV